MGRRLCCRSGYSPPVIRGFRILWAAAVCACILPVAPSLAATRSMTLTISQIYGGGGNSGATYTNDFVELHNVSSGPINVATMAVQSASATGTAWTTTALGGSAVPAGGYYLVELAGGAGGTTPLPTPDATGSAALSAIAGKVALTSTTTALVGTCPTAGVVDFVGYGSGTDCFEGSAGPAATASNVTAELRGADGCLDTDRNASDFAVVPPIPRNGASPLRECVPPQTTITSGPSGLASDASPSFGFTSSEPGSSFECSLDSEPFATCSSPKAYPNLPDGSHRFRVRATDVENNAEDPPVARSFEIDTITEGTATARKTQKQKGSKVSVRTKVKAGEDLDAKASGKVKLGKKSYKLKPPSKSVSSGKKKNLKLKPKKSKDAKKIAKALKQGKKAKAKLTVKLTDEAGNKKTQKLSANLKD